MSLDQLRYFVAVAEEGNLGRAAGRLHISQPPLTRQIHRLEDEVETPLFERTARGMRLLPEGETLLAHARRILQEVDAAKAALRPRGPAPDGRRGRDGPGAASRRGRGRAGGEPGAP